MAGFVRERNDFFVRFSEAFSPGEIARTRSRLEPYDPGLDHLDILERLGLLFFLQGGQLPRYRERLGIPPLNQAIITQVMHFCLQHTPSPLPMQVSVIEGALEQVEVTVTPDLVYLNIVRTGFEPARRGRSGAATPRGGRSKPKAPPGRASGSGAAT